MRIVSFFRPAGHISRLWSRGDQTFANFSQKFDQLPSFNIVQSRAHHKIRLSLQITYSIPSLVNSIAASTTAYSYAQPMGFAMSTFQLSWLVWSLPLTGPSAGVSVLVVPPALC